MSNARFLEKRVAEAFYGRFSRLRDVQEATIEPILAGRNLVLSSGTGSGKTEAVMAPLISRYWRELFQLNSLAIVYVSPTKALANDLHRRLEPPLDYLGLRIGIRHGDCDDLRKKTKPHVVITTPESLDVLLVRQDSTLKTVLAVVIDESHLLYNTQKGTQLSVLIRRLEDVVARPPLQLIAVSATIANLLDTARLIFGRQSNTDFLNFPPRRTIDAVVRDDDVSSLVSKYTKAREGKILGFVNSRKYAEYFAQELRNEPHLANSVFAHYSNLDALVRQQTEEEFAQKRTAVCLATSTLELGIDIGDIDAVMLLGVPSGIASFLQRIGRGNRREEKSNVVCFVGADTFLGEGKKSVNKPPPEPPLIQALRYITLIKAAQKGQLPSQRGYELFGAIAQQCLSIVASKQGKYTSLIDLAKSFEHLGYIQEETLKSILDSLVKSGYLIQHGYKNQYGAADLLHKLVADKKIYGNFPAELQIVKLVHKGMDIGEVHEGILLGVRRGHHILFAGKVWTIQKMVGDTLHIIPAPAGAFALPFDYIGIKPQFDAFLTDEMWYLIHAREFPYDLLHKDLQADIDTARKVAQALFSVHDIPYVEDGNYIRYYTFGGLLVNTAIALIHGQRFRLQGVTDCFVEMRTPVEWAKLPSEPMGYERVFERLSQRLMGRSIFQKLLPDELKVKEGIQEWLCDEAIGKVLRRLTSSKPLACTQRDRRFPLERPLYLDAVDDNPR